MFRSLVQVQAYLSRFTDYERMAGGRRHFHLHRMRRLMSRLDNPERSFRSIHIGGTKGKGSTGFMLEAILAAAGRRVGLYTSPHLVRMVERIRIGGEEVTERDFVWAMNRLRPALSELRPTFFEILTAAAFLLFREKRVEWAVVEVGLGGRLDATNVLVPEIAIVTGIDRDHTEILGRSLGRIAREKAGIIKSGVPFLTAERKPEPLKVLLARARVQGAPVFRLGRGIRLESAARPTGGKAAVLECAVDVGGNRIGPLRLRVPGEHQLRNAALAAAAAFRIGVSSRTIRSALARVRIPGRIEILNRNPLVIADVAHNVASIRAQVKALPSVSGRRWLVFGASRDKEWKEMLRLLRPHTDIGIMTRADHPRACSPQELAAAAPFPALSVASVRRAVALALKRAGKRDRIVITGSFYVVGEALQELDRGRR